MTDAGCDLLCIDFDHAESLRAALPLADEISIAAERLRGLGDQTRLRIANALHVGDELCVCDLAWIVGSSRGLVSHHLRQLRSAGLAESRRDGKLVMYRLTAVGHRLLEVILASVGTTSAQGERLV
jgi:DNA-binding transcriptional ArsR family regulator